MNGCNRNGSPKGRMKWLAVSLGAALLICPLKGAAQSKTEADEKREAVVDSRPAHQDPIESVKQGFRTASQNSKAAIAAPRSSAVHDAHNSVTNNQTQTKTIRIWDACDPLSFNAKVGPGTCIAGHHGQTDFNDFFGELQLDQIAGGWRFNPLLNTTEGVFKLVQLELEPGDGISLQNMGGETHTFTRVEKFAGGFFAPLNPLTGNPDPAPECARVLADGSLAPQPESDSNQFVEAGETELGPIAGTPLLPLGVTHWQCCVHPWMRINIAVRDRDHEHDQKP